MSTSAWFLDHARPRQYMRNAVYLNTGMGRFMEAAQMAGLAKSDWTWALKFGDLDNDGHVDLFIGNGMTGDFFNSDISEARRNGTYLPADRFYTIVEPDESNFKKLGKEAPLYVRREKAPGGKHFEMVFDDFARQLLLPMKHSQLGPGVAWGDR